MYVCMYLFEKKGGGGEDAQARTRVDVMKMERKTLPERAPRPFVRSRLTLAKPRARKRAAHTFVGT